jgi:cytochrome c-type biogenesis protein CcmH
MIVFIIGAVLLVLVTVALIVWPFRRRPAGADFSRQQLNAAIYRDQLAELERDCNEGALSQTDYDQARSELQRRLLEDTAAEATAAAVPPASRKLPIALALALPVAAIAGYLALGTPAAIDAPAQQHVSQADIDKMVTDLAARLEKEPGNSQGWLMLARSYRAMGRLPEALRAFEKAGNLVETDADLLLAYADTLASSVGGFDAKSSALIDKALQIDPAHPQGLWMRGTVHYDAKRYDKALADWEKLLSLLPPGSEDAQVIGANVAEVRTLLGKPAAPAEKVGSGKTAAAANIKGQVTLSAELSGKVGKGDLLMVVARPADGSRMPVAVLRVPAGKFPLDFTLDDSVAMSPDRPLSRFAEVIIEPRVSKSGQAIPQSGDLFGPAQTVKLGARGIVLKLDQVRP